MPNDYQVYHTLNEDLQELSSEELKIITKEFWEWASKGIDDPGPTEAGKTLTNFLKNANASSCPEGEIQVYIFAEVVATFIE